MIPKIFFEYDDSIDDSIAMEKMLDKLKQESSDENVATGKFYLMRPGKMRIEYDQPLEILIIVNGKVLTYQDLELEKPPI